MAQEPRRHAPKRPTTARVTPTARRGEQGRQPGDSTAGTLDSWARQEAKDLEVGGEDGGGARGGVEDGGVGVGLLELEDPLGLGQVAPQLRQALRLPPAERGGGRTRVAEIGQRRNR
jgi:hypothetical protein